MLPALEATLADLGVDLRAQKNVELDLEERPNKSPRAFCVPIEVPGRVDARDPADRRTGRLARALPRGRPHRALRAHVAVLTVEERRLGDNAVTEGWAMLLEHLTIDPAWLTRRLDFPRPGEFAAEGATQLLWLVRRYCAKLLYEIEFHAAADVTTMRPRYVELLADALKVDAERHRLPRRHRRRLLRVAVPPRVGVRGAAARLPAREVRQRVVHAPRRRLAAARALVGGPEADRGRAAQDVTGASIELEAVAERVREALAAA